jgi:hypothetical protein
MIGGMIGGTTIGKGKDREKRTIEEIEIEVMKGSTDGNLPTMTGEVEIIETTETTETAETTGTTETAGTIVVLVTTVTQESSDTSLETRDITDPSTRIDWSIHK